MWAPTVCPHAIPGAHTAIQKSNNPLHKAVDRLLCHLMPCDGCLTKNKDLQKNARLSSEASDKSPARTGRTGYISTPSRPGCPIPSTIIEKGTTTADTGLRGN
jgi:hypothetical protein